MQRVIHGGINLKGTMNESAAMLRSWANGQLHPKLTSDLLAAADEIERLEAELTSIAASLDNYARTEPDLSAAAEKAMRDLIECRVESANKSELTIHEDSPARDLTILKTKSLISQGMRISGFILLPENPDYQIALVDRSAVRWLDKANWWYLFHESTNPLKPNNSNTFTREQIKPLVEALRDVNLSCSISTANSALTHAKQLGMIDDGK